MSLGVTQLAEAARKLDAHDGRGRGLERLAGHDERHVEPAGPDGDGAQSSRGRGVGVGPDEGRAGPGEPLDVQVVADAVAGARVAHAVPGRERLQEAVVVRILEV